MVVDQWGLRVTKRDYYSIYIHAIDRCHQIHVVTKYVILQTLHGNDKYASMKPAVSKRGSGRGWGDNGFVHKHIIYVHTSTLVFEFIVDDYKCQEEEAAAAVVHTHVHTYF